MPVHEDRFRYSGADGALIAAFRWAADVALNPVLAAAYPFCRLSGPANVLVMPQAVARIALVESALSFSLIAASKFRSQLSLSYRTNLFLYHTAHDGQLGSISLQLCKRLVFFQ